MIRYKASSLKRGNPDRKKRAMARADMEFSKFIRTRDSQNYYGKAFTCISCGRTLPIRQADCGHYINRRHMSTRFSELNCNAQCSQCNRFDEGNIQGYRKGLFFKIGPDKLEELEHAKFISQKFTAFDLEEIAKHYKEETKRFPYQITYD